MKIRHLTYFIMLNFINQRAYFQRISYNFNEVLVLDIEENHLTLHEASLKYGASPQRIGV